MSTVISLESHYMNTQTQKDCSTW